MASVKSLGLHQPSGLQHAVQEELIPANAPASSYTWDITSHRHGPDPVEDELLTTSDTVIWCRGRSFRKAFRFSLEKEPVTQALLAFFPSSEDDRVPPIAASDTCSHHDRLDKALVVFLKTQAHIYFLSGTSHVVHMPFEVESACAGPVGVLIQRRARADNQAPLVLRFPRVPPSSFVSSQLSHFESSQQTTFSVESLGNPKALRLGLGSTLENMWVTPLEQPESQWPRLLSLTDPLSDLGLVVADPSSRNHRPPRKSASKKPTFLDPAEEILHIEELHLPTASRRRRPLLLHHRHRLHHHHPSSSPPPARARLASLPHRLAPASPPACRHGPRPPCRPASLSPRPRRRPRRRPCQLLLPPFHQPQLLLGPDESLPRPSRRLPSLVCPRSPLLRPGSPPPFSLSTSFNCLLPAHSCAQYSTCNEYNGKCHCPDGFGGDDCLEPLCGSLARGKDRPMRSGPACDCDPGWTGINCNVCTRHDACDALMETGSDGVCYQNGEVVNYNHQICNVTNRQITNLLGNQRPEVTFTCKKKEATCDFQFWVDAVESFYCHLSDCQSSAEFAESGNTTSYKCNHIKCSCIPGRMLCGKDGSIDLSEFLDQSIRGPGGFSCSQPESGAHNCAFKEPQMDKLIHDLIGDSSILLGCQAGECLYKTQVPGYKRPVKQINTPLIAGVIAGSALFVAAVIVLTWLLARRKWSHGPIRLDDSDDEGTKLMADHRPAALQFQNVSYSLNGKSILRRIQGICHPGEVTAIMGASGAGKTTFLDILARKNKRGQVGGDFYVNGELVADSDYKNVVGFVDQEDTMLPTLTVHETILNSALLRLPRHMSRAAKEQRVYDVEKELGIYHIRDSLIGSEEGKGRGISGGEKRRVGIACELVTSPSILFLDEPTSGLDAFNAYNVIECLVTLARNYKRTVIFTIHQPRSNIVALFDRLILLADGKAVFSGPFAQCQAYFDAIGYECPPGFNIADYLVDLTMHAGTTLVADPLSPPADAASVGPSSTKAVKSIASISGVSTGEESSIDPSPSPRPKSSRLSSVRIRQERELFTRRRGQINDTAASSDAGADDGGAYRLQNHPTTNNLASPQLPDDGHDLPPSAAGATALDMMAHSFAQSGIARSTHQEIQQAIAAAAEANRPLSAGYNPEGPNININASAVGKGYARVGYLRQFIILSQRTWRNLYRNPMLMLTHYAIAIILAVFSGYLFYGLTDDIPGFQNRLGLFFFLLALFGFSTLTSLGVFATERLLFVRERANGYYSPATYFAAKVLFDIIPLRIVPPILMGSIVYPMTGLVPDSAHFFKFITVLVLFNLAAAAICLFIGIVCKDAGVGNLIGSLVMLFSLLFAGFLLNHDATPAGALWLQTLSIFHYGFEALIVNEVAELTLVDHKYGLDITVPGAAILSSFGFDNGALWADIRSLGIFAASFIVLAYAAMHILLVEKR